MPDDVPALPPGCSADPLLEGWEEERRVTREKHQLNKGESGQGGGN